MNITAIKQQVKRSDRYSIFVDGTYAFSLSESGLIAQGLATGQEVDAAKLRQLKKAAGLDKAYGSALRFVALRPRSRWEVASYLQRKQVDPDAAQQIVHRLQELQLIDDTAFARAWVANRRTLKSVSKRRLRLELKQKQVADETIDQILAEDETDERQTLRDLIAKKRARLSDPRKLMQHLARQGFGYDDIKAALSEDEK